MIHITDKEVYTDDPTKCVHRIGTDIYTMRLLRFSSDTIETFEEVDTPSQEGKNILEKERKQRISTLIHERYSLDDEIALLRQKDNSDTKRVEYEEYCRYAELCKSQVDGEIVSITTSPSIG